MWLYSLLTDCVSAPSRYLTPSIHLRHHLPVISTVLFLVSFLLWPVSVMFKFWISLPTSTGDCCLAHFFRRLSDSHTQTRSLLWQHFLNACLRELTYSDIWENHTVFCNLHTTWKQQSCLHFPNPIKHNDWNPRSSYLKPCLISCPASVPLSKPNRQLTPQNECNSIATESTLHPNSVAVVTLPPVTS